MELFCTRYDSVDGVLWVNQRAHPIPDLDPLRCLLSAKEIFIFPAGTPGDLSGFRNLQRADRIEIVGSVIHLEDDSFGNLSGTYSGGYGPSIRLSGSFPSGEVRGFNKLRSANRVQLVGVQAVRGFRLLTEARWLEVDGQASRQGRPVIGRQAKNAA